ncbi:MAG: YfhO family protein [Chitinispirillaceae bacterium]
MTLKKSITPTKADKPKTVIMQRRDQKAPVILCAVVLFLIVVVFYHKVIFGIANFWEDLIYQELPHRIFARDSLSHFTFPFWNPYTFAGMPFFAAIHTGVFYPTNLLLSFLPLPMDQFWYVLELSIILHVFIAGMTMFLFCHYRGLSYLSSLFAAISFMLCGFFVVHIIHSLMLYILAWLPLIMLFFLRGIENKRPADFIYAAIVLGITIFAGHPQITFYEFLFLGAFCAYCLFDVSKNRLSHGILLLAAFVIAVGIAMILLLPSMELSRQSARVNWTFQMASEGSMSFRQLLTFFIPKLFGGTTSDNPWRQELSFWLKDAYHSGYWTFWETTFYTGLPVLIFGLVQFVNVRKSVFARFSLVWCVFSLFIALGNHFPLYRLLFSYIPGFGTFRIPARILFTWNLLLPLLASLTMDELKDAKNRRRYLLPLTVGGGISLFIFIAVSSGFLENVWPEFALEAHKIYATKQSFYMGGILLLSVLATALLYASLLKHHLYKIVMMGILCIDLFVFGMDYHIVQYSPSDYFSKNRPLAEFLSKENNETLFRTKMREDGIMLLDRNQGMIDKIQLMEGYNPLNLYLKDLPAPEQTRLDLFNVKYAIRIDSVNRSAGLVENPSFLPRAKMFYKAVIIPDDSATKLYLDSPDFHYTDEVVLPEKTTLALPVDTLPVANNLAITTYENNQIGLSVKTDKPGILWLSEIWYPAWKAIVDGKETRILRADYSFRAVEIAEGSHRVLFVYHSKAFTAGAIISIITAIGAFGVLLFFFRKGKCAMNSVTVR